MLRRAVVDAPEWADELGDSAAVLYKTECIFEHGEKKNGDPFATFVLRRLSPNQRSCQYLEKQPAQRYGICRHHSQRQ